MYNDVVEVRPQDHKTTRPQGPQINYCGLVVSVHIIIIYPTTTAYAYDHKKWLPKTTTTTKTLKCDSCNSSSSVLNSEKCKFQYENEANITFTLNCKLTFNFLL